MDVKEVVLKAKKYAAEIFADEGITNLGLEEVVFDGGTWRITVGFSRAWDKLTGPSGITTIGQMITGPARTYKVIEIRDSTEQIVAVKNREPRS